MWALSGKSQSKTGATMPVLIAALVALGVCPPISNADEPTRNPAPTIEVKNVRRVFHNGEHNAFTDLIRFRDQFFLVFRSCPDGHMVHPTASIIVLRSPDLKTWKQVYRFSVRHRDTRDPHFLIFRNRLFVYTGTWYSGPTTLPISQYDLNQHLGYAVVSEDGIHWSKPQMLEGTFGHYIWRAAAFNGKAYLCARRKIGFAIKPRGEPRQVESLMLESDDGLVWRRKAVFQEIDGDETAFLFDQQGSVLGVGRRGRDKAQLLKSSPPYVDWKRTDLAEYVGGPLICRWGQNLLVGGRQMTRQGPRTALYWLIDNQLHKIAELPSGGDNSYPGFVELDSNRAVVSWYSSHEKIDGKVITAIYLADLETRSGR